MTALDCLRQARAMLDPTTAWVQQRFGAYRNGNDADLAHADAWSIDGAIHHAAGWTERGGHQHDALRVVQDAFHYLSEAVGGTNIAVWNDEPGRVHLDVTMALDKAISLAEQDATSPAAVPLGALRWGPDR